MSAGRDPNAERVRLVKILFGLAAFVCVLTGYLLYVFAAELGMEPETARLVATAFLVAGVADYLVLRFWDRIVRFRGPPESSD